MISLVIIDDEVSVRNNLKQIIADSFNDVFLLDEASSVKTGLELLEKSTPDVVLLDINLSDGSGFNILEQLSTINFRVIFITAYDEYAIKAFKFNALDYILKPVDIDHLKQAIDRVKELTQHNYITKEDLKLVLDNYSKNDDEKQLVLNEANKVSFVNLKDIIRCEADSNYTIFYFNDKTKKTVAKTLKSYEQLLPTSLFYRANLSCIINLKYVKEYNKGRGGYIILKDDTKVEIARRRKDEFLTRLKQRFS